MKKTIIGLMTFFLAGFFLVSTVSAAVMEFDNPAPYEFSSYSEDGINLTVVGTPAWGPQIYSGGADNWLHIDGAYMTFDMGGAVFNLDSIDFLTDTGGDATIGVGGFAMAVVLGVMDFTGISEFQGITSFWIDTDLEDVINQHFELDSVVTSSGAAPVPEPGTFLLLGAGLTGLALYRRQRKNT